MRFPWFRAAALLAFPLLAVAAAPQPDLTLGIAEGTSGELTTKQIITKYQGLADIIGRSIGRKVQVAHIRELSDLENSMKSKRYDFIMARPSDYPSRGLRRYGYEYVATADPDGHCLILTPKGSPIQNLEGIRGKRIVLPKRTAYMTKFCAAELRDHGIDLFKEKLQFVDEQSLIGIYLEGHLADVGVGVASFSGMAKRWQSSGHNILHRSVGQPYFPLIALPKITLAQREAIRKALIDIPNQPADQPVLKTIGIEGFNVQSEERLRKLLDWMDADIKPAAAPAAAASAPAQR